MSLPCERETVIQFDDESKELHIFTTQSTFVTKMNRLGYEPYKVVEEAHYYRGIPAKCLSIRKPSIKKRKPISEEHKAKLLAARGRKKASE